MTSLTSQNNNNTTFNFQPNENDIKGILALLEQTQSPDNNVQRQVFNQLKVLEQNKEFSLYLSFTLLVSHIINMLFYSFILFK